MKAFPICALLFCGLATVANAAIRNDDPIERMASGALKAILILVIIGVVALFKKNKNK
jgi:hypothetical protein